MGRINKILGLPISSATINEVVDASLRSVNGLRSSTVFSCANPHSLVLAQKDEKFYWALQNSTIVVNDGVGITLMGALLRINVGPRITGYDYFYSIMRSLDEGGSGRVFFLDPLNRFLI
jgi:N-acetylglucosaminyldiphosphoundecaprenol N-acetyl-beta-D-mannosaminyltransferase